MKFFRGLLFFVLINFSTLAVGVFLMNDGPRSQWYSSLNKAPWSPPGWVFGLAWSSIMLLFSVYMTFLVKKIRSKKIMILFSAQFLLNIVWNYLFFNQHLISLGLLNILFLTILMFYFLVNFKQTLKSKSFFVLPYCLWLVLATSLNLYIALFN